MKTNSTNLKKSSETSVVRAFWGKEWRDLLQKEEKIQAELEGVIRELDKDPNIQEMLGRDQGALNAERTKARNSTQASVEKVWSQVERFASVRPEIKKGNFTKRRIDELLGLAEEVFQILDRFGQETAENHATFLEENKETIQLEKDLRDGDKVKGFDLEDANESELMFDLGKFEELFGDEEQKMVEKFYFTCDLLAKKRNLEMEAIEENDVGFR